MTALSEEHAPLRDVALVTTEHGCAFYARCDDCNEEEHGQRASVVDAEVAVAAMRWRHLRTHSTVTALRVALAGVHIRERADSGYELEVHCGNCGGKESGFRPSVVDAEVAAATMRWAHARIHGESQDAAPMGDTGVRAAYMGRWRFWAQCASCGVEESGVRLSVVDAEGAIAAVRWKHTRMHQIEEVPA